ncbi:MAG: hypothetical protein WC829_15845 [Hyphomicrobium sp.]
MSGTVGMIVGLVILALGLGGLGFAFDQMMTHADPDAALKAAAGIVTFAVSAFITLAIIR